MGLGCLQKMHNNDSSQSSKQTLQDVLTGEEPTEEFLEEFRALEESEEISEIELTKLALATQADNKVKSVGPDYRTNETNISSILLVVTTVFAAIYFLFIS